MHAKCVQVEVQADLSQRRFTTAAANRLPKVLAKIDTRALTVERQNGFGREEDTLCKWSIFDKVAC